MHILVSVTTLIIQTVYVSSFLNTVNRLSYKTNLESKKYLLFMEIPNDKQSANDIRDKLLEKKYNEAYQILKRNPMAPITMADAKELLNNFDSLAPVSGDNQKESAQSTEIATYIYKRLERQKVLRGYGCVDGEYPEKSLDISPAKLEELSGLKISALTPKQRTTYWRLAGIGLCAAEFAIGNAIGIDPIYTLIPLTVVAVVSDQIFLRGAVFETTYQTLFPVYKKKVIAHEAGHFLIAYLLGLTVRGCITSAWQARKYPEIRGQAGTIFYDSRLMDEVAKQKVKRSSLDRLSVVIMAGIAAEALMFNNAEGGAADEQNLVNFFTSIQPPWNLLRIQAQARWGVLQALLIIKEHQAAYDALVEVLCRGGGVGDCIEAIENNLPENLPSLQRLEEREKRMKRVETDKLLRFIQKMTWKVGGIEPLNSTATDSPFDQNDAGLGAREPFREGLPADGPAAETQSVLDAVTLFTEKIRVLENAARTAGLPQASEKSGVWLNDLDSIRNAASRKPIKATIRSSDDGDGDEGSVLADEASADQSLISSGLSQEVSLESMSRTAGNQLELKIPEPLPDFDKRLEAFQANETLAIAKETGIDPSAIIISQVDPSTIALMQSSTRDTGVSPKDLLQNHRGYQLRLLENQEIENKRKIAKIEKRLIDLKKEMISRETVSSGRSSQSKW